VHSFIQKEFVGVLATFQIRICYRLVDRYTGEERIGEGFLFPDTNLTKGTYLFPEYTRYNLQVQLCGLRGTAAAPWTFFEGFVPKNKNLFADSAIVTLNARLHLQHPSLVFRGFNAATRKNVCFELPQ
jgi:hypothetical protein